MYCIEQKSLTNNVLFLLENYSKAKRSNILSIISSNFGLCKVHILQAC